MRAWLAGVAVAAAAFPVWAGIGAWTPLASPNANGGGLVRVLAADRTNTALRYAATDTGFYVSRDGGQSWSASNAGIVPSPAGYRFVNDMAVGAAAIYIAPTFLQKSNDRGSSWARTGWVSENPQAYVLALHPQDDNTVWAGSNRGVYRSADGGATWTYVSGTLPVNAIAVDPGNPQVVFRAVSTGIFRTVDGGTSWTQVSAQLTSVRRLVVDPRNSAVVYAATSGAGVFKSGDGGTSWSAINRCVRDGCVPPSLDNEFVSSLVVDPADSSKLYVGSTNGLYRSLDAGATWRQANNGPIGVSALMLDPLQRDTVIGADGARLYSYTFPAASDAERIFAWAEAAYPQYFAPRGAASQTISGYLVRYYSATDTYLGVRDGNVYVYGAVFGGLALAGTVAQLLTLAAAAGY